jgi:hypothetical protein
MDSVWDTDWSRFAQDDVASYVTPPLQTSMVMTGPGYADLWIRSDASDVTLQVTLSEIRPDGLETLIQSGWLRAGHRAFVMRDAVRVERTYAMEDFALVVPGVWTPVRVSIPSFAHPMRAGSSLRMAVSAPGRDHATWRFTPPEGVDGKMVDVGWGDARPSSLTLGTLSGDDIPSAWPECAWLRGQPCREYVPSNNVPADL